MAWTSPLERVPLEDLLLRHRGDVRDLRSALGADLAEADWPDFADDVWLLRYVLSFQAGTSSAAAAARQAIHWRQENVPLVEAARRRAPPSEFTEEELLAIELFFAAAYHGTSQLGDPIFISRLSANNLEALMDRVSEEKMERWIGFTNECVWQYCEAATRRRGVFVKQINLQDATATSMVQDRRFLRALGRSSKTNDWLRPQLVGKTYVFNAPSWMKMAHRLAGTVMSQRSMEKVAAHPAHVGAVQRPCAFAERLLGGAEALPTFLGGTSANEEAFPSAPRAASAAVRAGGRRGREPLALAGLPPPPGSGESASEARRQSPAAASPPSAGQERLAAPRNPLSVFGGADATVAVAAPAGPPEVASEECRCCWRVCGRRRRGAARQALLPA